MWERISGYTFANEGENQLLYVGAPQLKKQPGRETKTYCRT